MIPVMDGIAIAEHELSERFVRASGPGGQNVNKVATAVELRFDVGASSLPEDVKARLAALAGNRISADGVLLIDSRAHRTQSQNRAAARERLLELLLRREGRAGRAGPPARAGSNPRRLARGPRRTADGFGERISRGGKR
jgi:ribosome-associated protein